jgi:hypothetical protein
MTKSSEAIFRWAKGQSDNLTKILFWCSMALTFFCELAAITVIAAISTNSIQADSEVWTAVWFFSVASGISWIVGRAGDVGSGYAIGSGNAQQYLLHRRP